MKAVSPSSPLGDFNQILSEAIDLLEDVKQADWKVPETHELHRELDRLLVDLVAWDTELSDEDHTLGVSALSFMPSLVERHPQNLWQGDPTDEAVCVLVGDHLHRLERHLQLVRSEMLVEGPRRALDDVERGINGHRQILLRIAAESTISN